MPFCYLIIISLMMVGCPDSSKQPDSKSDSSAEATFRFVWETKKRPYRIIKVDEKNCHGRNREVDSKQGVCHRYVNAVYQGTINRSEINDAGAEIYLELKRDVERSCKHCPHKLIIVRLYHPDQNVGKTNPMLMFASGNSATAKLPSAANAQRIWFDDGAVIEKLRGLSK